MGKTFYNTRPIQYKIWTSEFGIHLLFGLSGTGDFEARQHLLDDLKERTVYCKLKEEALYHPLWRTRFGRGYGPVVRQTTELINERINE